MNEGVSPIKKRVMFQLAMLVFVHHVNFAFKLYNYNVNYAQSLIYMEKHNIANCLFFSYILDVAHTHTHFDKN